MLPVSEKPAAFELIRHLQTMYAYQQLAMEGVNDAFALAAGTGTPSASDEVFVRAEFPFWQPLAVAKHVLPALETKLQIMALMGEEHVTFPPPASGPMRVAYDDFTHFLTILRQRARLQYESFNAWTRDPSLEIDVSGLDSEEMAAGVQSSASLNTLIAEAGLRLNEDPWLQIKCDAINHVRASVGLPSFSVADLREQESGFLMGRPVRFFRD